MCGIFASLHSPLPTERLIQAAAPLQRRGPDRWKHASVAPDVHFIFHRLAIMGLSPAGDQPMQLNSLPHLTLICNGEIYNFRALAERYGFELTTGSDCEIIPYMLNRFGIQRTVQELDGVFMFVIHNQHSGETLAARDRFGVRPGFIGNDGQGLYLASEAKALTPLCQQIAPFPPGHWWSSHTPSRFTRWYAFPKTSLATLDETEITANIRDLLTTAVHKRLMSERKIGALLSGGLDSSLIAGLVAQEYGSEHLETFSIGLPESVDLLHARQVANWLGSRHHEIVLQPEHFLAAIEEVIYAIESYDTTSVRASVGNYLVSQYIAKNSDCKVIFNGDGSDEVTGGYLYLQNAPTPQDFQRETERLVQELYLFDVLRSDRSISAHGLEARTPFLDRDFVDYYLRIPPQLKTFDGIKRPEKYLLRKAFSGSGIIPESVLWRPKCAFSDGVSPQHNSWHRIIQDFVNQQVSDEEFQRGTAKITHCKPILKESFYYRKVYERLFGAHDRLIPHFWMPRWSDVTDPSARELSNYRE